MKSIDVKSLKDNFFEAISKEWMLVTAGDKEGWNTMTASWGCMGWLWNRPVAVVFIRPERHTHQFAETCDRLTLSFLGNEKEMRAAYNFCGTKSGRDYDKARETGLTPIETEHGGITFAQARLTLDCRKLYKDNIDPQFFLSPDIEQWYGAKGGYHDFYIVEIEGAYLNEE